MPTVSEPPDQVPARIEPSGRQMLWKSSEISRMVTTPMTRERAAQLVSRLLGGYPSLSLHDPETYIASVTSLLCGFSWWVGERAIEKVSTESKFVPSKAEIAESCKYFAPSRQIVESKPLSVMIEEATAAARLEKERRLLAPPKQTMEELRAEMAARGVHMRGPVAHKETAASVMAKTGLTQEQWDAIPDAPPAGHWESLVDAYKPVGEPAA